MLIEIVEGEDKRGLQLARGCRSALRGGGNGKFLSPTREIRVGLDVVCVRVR
ncbi:MAG: hypothetical protein AAB867_01665 [Patescibacteria group bacterium]